MSREYYPAIDILPDAVLVAKTLITAARLYNALWACGGVSEIVQDCIETIYFYLAAIARRYNIEAAPTARHDEYNVPFRVLDILRPTDLAALILQKALRIHSVFHACQNIHGDSVSDAMRYLDILRFKLQ